MPPRLRRRASAGARRSRWSSTSDAVVQPLDGEVEVAPVEASRASAAVERGEIGDALARIAVPHLEAATVVAVVGRDRLEHVVLDVARRARAGPGRCTTGTGSSRAAIGLMRSRKTPVESARLGHERAVLVDREVGVVLEQQRNARRVGRGQSAREHRDDVAALGLDQLRTPHQLRAVEARDDAQNRAAERDRPLEPSAHATDAHRRRVAVSALAEEVSGGEQTKAERVGALGERAELVELPIAHVVEVDLHALGAELGRLRRARPRASPRRCSRRRCQQSVSTPSLIIAVASHARTGLSRLRSYSTMPRRPLRLSPRAVRRFQSVVRSRSS